jgi:chaperonin GroEL
MTTKRHRAVRREESACDGDEGAGLRILARALEAPTRAIADSSGYDAAATGARCLAAARGR